MPGKETNDAVPNQNAPLTIRDRCLLLTLVEVGKHPALYCKLLPLDHGAPELLILTAAEVQTLRTLANQNTDSNLQTLIDQLKTTVTYPTNEEPKGKHDNDLDNLL